MVTISNFVHAVHYVNFILLRNFIDIINNRYGLLIGAKYHSSNMNDAYTKSLYNIVGCPTKVVWLTTFFPNSEHLFVRILCQQLASQPGVNL